MSDQKRTFSEMLDSDLASKGWTQNDLARELADPGEDPISEQAISNWKSRGYPPRSRWEQLKSLLGPESEVGRAELIDVYGGVVGAPERVYQRKVKTPPTFYGGGTSVPITGDGSQSAPNALQRLARSAAGPNRTFPKPSIPSSRVTGQAAADEAWLKNLEQLILEMPESLRQNLHREVRIGGHKYLVDYESHKAVAEVMTVPDLRELDASRRFITLSILRSAQDGGRDRTYGVILLLLDDTPLPSRLDRWFFEAGILGFRFVIARTIQDVAITLAEWESGEKQWFPAEY